MSLKGVSNVHLLVAKDCIAGTLPISQNEMLWWSRHQIVIITRVVNQCSKKEEEKKKGILLKDGFGVYSDRNMLK